MKKIIVTTLIMAISAIVTSQNKTVEKSIFGIQTGFLGGWIYNESKISNSISIRLEAGLNSQIYGNDIYDRTVLIMVPEFNFEPRWYYNLNQRDRKSKNTLGNSGNFISLKSSYHPKWFEIANNSDIDFVSDISVIPTWGMRRNIGKHFNYELGIGFGYVKYINRKNSPLPSEDAEINLHLRLGYDF